MKIRAFITHKISEDYSDCQDRFSVDRDNLRIAVSDGMSQSIFPEWWAELLAHQYTEKGTCNEEDRQNLCQQWHDQVMEYLHSEKDKGNNPWRLENTINEKNGAGATICGVTFKNATDWEGQVLGDSCILIVDKKSGKVEIHTSEDKPFDSYPDYYESFVEKQGRGKITSCQGSIDPDHVMLLVSDPFSEYAYNHRDGIGNFINIVLALKDHNDFCEFVDNMRKNENLHNDDSTLCIVEFDNSLDFNIEYKDDIDKLIKDENDSRNEESSNTVPSEQAKGETDKNEKINPCQEGNEPKADGSPVTCTVTQGGKEMPLEQITSRKVEEISESQKDLEALCQCVLNDLDDLRQEVINCINHALKANRGSGKLKLIGKKRENASSNSKKCGESIKSVIENKFETFRKAVETQYNHIKNN
jgi:hypothetical protein